MLRVSNWILHRNRAADKVFPDRIWVDGGAGLNYLGYGVAHDQLGEWVVVNLGVGGGTVVRAAARILGLSRSVRNITSVCR